MLDRDVDARGDVRPDKPFPNRRQTGNWFIFKNILENDPINTNWHDFFLMQQVSHIFYAMVFLVLGSSGKR